LDKVAGTADLLRVIRNLQRQGRSSANIAKTLPKFFSRTAMTGIRNEAKANVARRARAAIVPGVVAKAKPAVAKLEAAGSKAALGSKPIIEKPWTDEIYV